MLAQDTGSSGASLAAILPTSRQWHLLRCAPSCEAKVRRQCEELGIEAYFPVGLVFDTPSEGHRRQRRGPRPRPAMPGYVFIGFRYGEPHFDLFVPDQRWRDHPPDLGFVEVGDTVCGPIRREQHPIGGALGWVASDGRPATVPGRIVADIKARETHGDFNQVTVAQGKRFYVPRWLKIGVSAVIEDGPFRGSRGEIIRLPNRESARVQIVTAWASFPVDIPIRHLRPATTHLDDNRSSGVVMSPRGEVIPI